MQIQTFGGEGSYLRICIGQLLEPKGNASSGKWLSKACQHLGLVFKLSPRPTMSLHVFYVSFSVGCLCNCVCEILQC